MNVIAQHFDKLDLAYNVVQAGSTYKANDSQDFFSRIKKHEGKLLFTDFVSLVFLGVQSGIKLNNHYWTYIQNAPSTILVYPVAVLIIGVVTTIGINKLFRPTMDPKFTHSTFDRPENEKCKQGFYVMRMVVNVTLCFFSPMGPIAYISIALELYSLAKVTQRKWVKCETTKPANGTATSVKAVYHFLLHPKKIPQNDDCTICLDPVPDTPFCENHFFHEECIIGANNAKAPTMLTGLDKIRGNRTRYYNKYGTKTRTTATYTATLPRSSLPSCPLGRCGDALHEFEVKVKDNKAGDSPTTITWVD